MNNPQQRILERIAECIQVAEKRLNKTIPMPEVRFNQRGKIAGTAHLQRWELRFNPILMVNNMDDFLSDVVPHEVAHLIVFQLFGKVKPHGREWQAVMEGVFKRPALTTHQFDVSQVQGQLFPYRCHCQEHQLTIRRHNRVRRGQSQYRCKQCQQPLQYIALR